MLLSVSVVPALDGLPVIHRTPDVVIVITEPRPDNAARFVLNTYLLPEERSALWDVLWAVYDGLTPNDDPEPIYREVRLAPVLVAVA